MPIYIVFSLLAALAFGLSSVFSKLASKHQVNNPWVLIFYSYLTFFPLVALFPFFFEIGWPTAGWPFLFLNALCFFLGLIFFNKALYRLDASTMAPFFQLQAAFLAVLAFVFLKEKFPSQNYLYLMLIVIGSILVSLDERMHLKSYLRLGILWIILQQFFHASANLFAGFAVREMDSFTFLYWSNWIGMIFPLLLMPFIGSDKLKISLTQFKPIFLAAFFSVAGAAFQFKAFETNVTISGVLCLLTAPIVLLISIVLSRFRPEFLEHHTARVYLVRALGVAIILIGAVKISLGQ